MEQCEWSFVVYAPVECGDATSAVHVKTKHGFAVICHATDHMF